MAPPANFAARAEWLSDRLSDRDIAIVETVHRLHLVTGKQIEELYFSHLLDAFRRRKRVMRRLVKMRALTVYQGRRGGPDGGAGANLYSCDPAASALIHALRGVPLKRKPRIGGHVPVRLRPHTLAVAELYVRLAVKSRETGEFTVPVFRAEPDCWWPNTSAPVIKPDAHLILTNGAVSDHWWAEIDLGTESVPTVRERFTAYLDFAAERRPGPGGVIPRVLVTVLDANRRAALKRTLATLEGATEQLIQIVKFDDAPAALASELLSQPPSQER